MTPPEAEPQPVPTPPAARRRLPGTVLWLGVVSLLTDASGEMIYPLLPLFLSDVLKAAPTFIAFVEGVAETTASLLKIVSGRIADRSARKKPLTLLGYTLSSLARPLVALAQAPWMVLAVRFTDRIGKGLRSSPRDALVASVTPAGQRGAAYGYHRAMDNGGAVLGPLIGFALYQWAHLPLRTIFALAAVPGALAVASLLFGVRETPAAPQQRDAATQQDAAAPRERRALIVYLVAVALFTLANATDAFLLLRARALGFSDGEVLLVWTLHNAVKALLSRRFGALSDRVGRRVLIGAGWLFYAAIYVCFGLAHEPWHLWALFPAYGLYYALVEGSERALVADLAGPNFRGRAFGWFHGVSGLLALPASLGFSLLYHPTAPLLAFTVAAGFALVATVVLALSAPRLTSAG